MHSSTQLCSGRAANEQSFCRISALNNYDRQSEHTRCRVGRESPARMSGHATSAVAFCRFYRQLGVVSRRVQLFVLVVCVPHSFDFHRLVPEKCSHPRAQSAGSGDDCPPEESAPQR